MIKIGTILILINLLTDLVNGHGFLNDPPGRIPSNKYRIAEFSGGLCYQYYYRGGDLHVCGNSGFTGGSWVKNTQITGNITRTYKSGTSITMNAMFTFPHGGYFRIKLCKLNSPSEIVSQECFDQEVLKVESIEGYPGASLIDEYTVNLPWLKTETNRDMNFTVKLPAGLTCENCVILWDWKQTANYFCKYANGSTNGLSENDKDRAKLMAIYGENICPQQSFRTCSDIKIEPNPDIPSQVYKPNPIKPVIDSPKVFACRTFGLEYSQTMTPWTNPNKRPDPHKYTGSGLFCVVEPSQQASCDICRENCMSPDKQCPDYCYCRWFPKKLNVYQTPIEPTKWDV